MHLSHNPIHNRTCFRDTGKGWYNLEETSWETYVFSKLRRLLAVVRLGMEDALRTLAEGSMVKFVAFIQACCAENVDVVSPSCVVRKPHGGGSSAASTGTAGFITTPAGGRRTPLLLTELVLTAEGVAFTYTTEPDTMHARIIALFNRAMTKLQVRHGWCSCGSPVPLWWPACDVHAPRCLCRGLRIWTRAS